MQLESFFNAKGDQFSFTRQQASDFAKLIADDFNPIHDIESKRFCVPGDLLFAVALYHRGISSSMQVKFADMVGAGIDLHFESEGEGNTDIIDNQDKTYLAVHAEGNNCRDPQLISKLTEQYVAFSGTTFPHVLVPLWRQEGVMVNPARPLVIYESMSIELDSFEFVEPSLKLINSNFEVAGKRGNVTLRFTLNEDGKELGHGEKSMILGGLKPYDQSAIDNLIEFYDGRKQAFAQNNSN